MTGPGSRQVARLLQDSVAEPLERPKPSAGPNVLLVMLDDVGFGSCSTFGGPVPTPGVDKVASRGLIYNQFHTTALCSPTRAALLTGRNHHAVHMGAIPEGANSFPGYDTVIPPQSALVAEVLKQHGYSTACFGKWHLTPTWEHTPVGPFDHWPTGMGFERFYGIIGAECSMYEPAVYDQTTPVEPYVGRDDYHFSEDMADKAIEWIHKQKAAAPDRPFFCYFAPPAVHAPHHVWPDWIEKFDGSFDEGWDRLREEIFQRQLDMGVIPAGTALTPRPDEIPSWDDYPDTYKPVARRLMEVFAAFLAHTDAQVERVIDAIDELGVGGDTMIIYLTGDNGASAEGTIHGAWSAPSFQNGQPEDPEWLLEHMDDFGSARCENHFNVGWAWALDSPFQWMKQVASHFGGTRNGLAISWPNGIEARGELRDQFHHVVDLTPTILAAAGIEPPSVVAGVEQMAVNGVDMSYSFSRNEAPSQRTTQYFEILGNRGIYHEGWMASCFHGRVPWKRYANVEFDGPQENWELYNISEDFSQSVDLAAAHPDRLAEMQELFDREATENGVYPLRDPGSPRIPGLRTPQALGEVKRMTYTSSHVRIPEWSIVNLKNSSHEITGDIHIAGDEHDSGMSSAGGSGASARGVIACQGGNMAGWSMYLDDGVPTFLYNCFGHEHNLVRGGDVLGPGRHQIRMLYEHDGGFGAGGLMTLFVDGDAVDETRLERTVPVVFSMSGETFDVGVDTGAPVGSYEHGFACTAEILGVTLERLSDPDPEVRRAMAAGAFKAIMASQ